MICPSSIGRITPPQMPFDGLRTGFVGGLLPPKAEACWIVTTLTLTLSTLSQGARELRPLLRSHVAIALATERGRSPAYGGRSPQHDMIISVGSHSDI